MTAAVAVAALAGCGRPVHTLAFPVPAPTVASTSTTTVLAHPSSVDEPLVAGGSTTTTIALGPGRATVSGVVDGPAGAVAGATVRIERLVGDQTAFIEVQSLADGTFSLSDVVGGRYRVRAWKPPSLAMTAPQVVFVANGATSRLRLAPASFTGPTVTSSFAPDPSTSGSPTAIVVEVTTATVSPDGIVQYLPAIARRVKLVGAGYWTVTGPDPALTDVNGEVTFLASCGPAGDDPLTAIVERVVPVNLPTPLCLAAPPPVTTTVTPTTTVAPTTTTTATTHHHRVPPTTTSARGV